MSVVKVCVRVCVCAELRQKQEISEEKKYDQRGGRKQLGISVVERASEQWD